MFRNKLGVRIAIIVVLPILFVELTVGIFTVLDQKKALLTKRLESLQFASSLLEVEIAHDVKHSRFQELSRILSDLAGGFSAYSYTLINTKGEALVQQALKEGYQGPPVDLKESLESVSDEKSPPVQMEKSAEGDIFRYMIPLHDDEGEVMGGLSLDTPTLAIDSSIKAFIWKTGWKVGLVFLAITIIVTTIIMTALYFLVAKPLEIMRQELVALSRGEADLTYQIKVGSQDEIGETARCFNLFIGKIRLMVTRVMEHSLRLTEQVQTMMHSTNEVSAMSEDVTTTVQQIAKGAEEQASKIAEVNHLMQEMQDTMKEVEKKARETSGAVDKATQTAKAGGRLAHGTIDKMGVLNEIILKNSEMVGRLGTRSKEIGRAVEIISGIAEQTNLLSLNAAIEAARAGEQGRGFAVVAEEIRALADGASRATQEITDLVQEIQDATSAVVESMDKGAAEAQVGKESIRMMEGSLDEIIIVVENVVEHSKNITSLTGVQSQRYAKIMHGIQDINAVSEESAASTEEVSASTQEQAASMEQVGATCKELAAMAGELKTMVEKFKIN